MTLTLPLVLTKRHAEPKPAWEAALGLSGVQGVRAARGQGLHLEATVRKNAP